MTVDITQEEMNILNLNGITVEDVQNNINLMRASGFDDDSIRQQYTDAINTFKPITKTAVTDTKNIEKWNKQGGITPFEYAKRKTNMYEFDGTYNNVIDTNEDKYNKAKTDYENRAKKQIQERKERDKRVNEGTASFLDRVGAWTDRAMQNPYPAATYEEFNKRFEKENLQPSVDWTVPESSRPDYKAPEKDMSKKIGFTEALSDNFKSGGWIPSIGGFIEGADDKKQLEIQNKIIKGQPIRQDELDFLNHRIEEQKEKNVRGYTIGGAIADSYLNSLIRFGGEIAAGTAIFEGLGLASEIPEGANALQKIGVGLKNAGKFGLLNTILPTTYDDTYENYQQRRLNDSFRLTEDGKVYFQEAEEKPATSFMKSLLTTYLMFSTEAMGEVIGVPIKGVSGVVSNKVGKPLFDALKKNKNLTKFVQDSMPALSKAYEKLNNMPIKGKSLDWLKSKVKYDGFIEELGEEVLEDVLNVTFEIDQERTLENYAKAIFKSPDEWAVLCGTIALQGGTLSIASHLLGNYMMKNGASEEEAIQTLEKLGEEGTVEQLSKLVEEGEIDVDDYNSYEKRRERAVESVAESLKNINKGKDYSKNAAEMVVRVAEHISELNQNFDMEEILERDKPEVKNYNTDSSEATLPLNDDINIIDNRIDEIYREVDSLTEDNKEYSDKLMAEADLLEKLRNNTLDESEVEEAQNLMSGLRNVVYNQSAQYAGASENEIEEAAKEWEEKGTDSKFFRRWTDNTPVVSSNEAKTYDFKDGEGVTIDLFHGTRGIFDTFDINKKGQASDTARVGFWFADTENFADNFASDIWYGEQEKPVVMHCFVTMKKPKVYEEKIVSNEEKEQAENKVKEIENKIEELNRQFNKIVQETGSFAKATEAVEKPREQLRKELKEAKNIYAELRYTDAYEQLRTDIRKIEGGNAEDANFGGLGMVLKNQDTVEKFVESLKEQGYDGIIIKGTHFDSESAGTETNNQYAVFSPEQIKSVDNRGTFDANNPNIYYQNTFSKIVKTFRKVILNGDDTRVKDVFSSVSEFNSLRKYFNNVMDVSVIEMPKWMKSDNKLGFYMSATDTIYMNFDKINEYPNKQQTFIRVFLHELLHAKQAYWKAYAKENKNNKNLTEAERKILKEYLKLDKISNKDDIEYKFFELRNLFKNKKDDKELAKLYKKYHNKYENEIKEIDADNVALALQAYIGNTNNGLLLRYLERIRRFEDLSQETETNKEIAEIRAFNERNRSNHFGFGRLSDNVDTRTFYQNEINQDNINDKNLLMTHSARVERLDDILESGSLVAPSMAITKKGEKSLNFGGVVFVRNPEKINFNEDNIYDRDIYSPRLPQADYETSDGYFVSAYDYESMERLWKNNPERFKQNYGGKTFEEYFKGAKKVINLGFTPSGNRRTQPYNNQNLLNYIKRESLLSGENWDYGLSSLLAKLADKQSSMEDLKKNAKKELKNSSEELDKQWQDIRDEFEKLEEKLKPYYSNKYVYLFEVMSDVVYSIEKNNKRKLSEYFDNPLPKEVVKDVKDFVKKARKIPRSYFEAKPMKEVPLNEFMAVLVPEEVTKEQRQKLQDYGLEVIEYENGKLNEALNKVKRGKIYFQFAGERSKTADKNSLKNAIKMIVDGYDAEKVRKQTGWFKGVDGKWRYEISDNDAKINEDFYNRAMAQEKNMAEYDENNLKVRDKISKVREKRDSLNDRLSELYAIIDEKGQGKEVAEASKEIAKLNKEYTEVENELDKLQKQLQDLKDDINSKVKGLWNMTLGDLLDHEKLYAAYPSIKNVRIEFRDFGNSVQGSYSEIENQINLSNKLSIEEVKKVLMHEIQHYIQDVEGFAQGSSTNSVERQLRKSLEKIIYSSENVKYEELMDELSIVNRARLVHNIYVKPENITKTYWFLQKGKGWYAPKKTSKKARKQFIDECCQEFLSETIEKYKDELTKTYPQELKLDRYNSYLQKSKAELDKIAKSLDGKAGRMLAKVDNYNANKIKSALKTFEEKGETSYGLSELYHKVAGEVEARNTSSRMNMSDEERMNVSPSETADVNEWEQLVVFDDGSLAFSESDMSGSDSEEIFDKLKSDSFINTLDKRGKRGAYIPAEKVIELYKNSDESTFLHEMAHWYLDLLTEYAEGSEELTAELNEVRKWLKNDGGEFTVAQHEKFARGFEAYIRSGYAKSNKLKKVFEYFKNFLLDIYQSLKQLDIKEEEMPQIISLFDRLLSTEKERIQSTVFDKISEIDEQIEKIKENEVKEFEYLDSVWEESQQKAINNEKVQEYLRLADKVTARETKEVREFKKRYKDATLEILEAATGKPRTWIANSKNWEKLQELLDKTDDKITVSVGMQDSWREFYSDTGVGFENDETDGDYNLAEQAFEVMTEGSYNRTFEEDYQYDEINKYLEKFDYLAAKVKSEKYENKQAALNALEYFYNHIDENMPSMPEEILKSVGERIMKVQEDTYDSIKENYNKKSSLSGAMQLQAYITQKLDDLKVYNPETRYKMRLNKSHRLYKFIKNVRSVNSAKKELRRINDFIIDDMRNNQRSLLSKEIQKQITVNSKLVKVGNMKKGKFDYRTNTVFAELVKLNRLSRKDAEIQLGALIKIQDAAKGEQRDTFDENPTSELNKTNNFEDKLKNEFLQYRSMRLQDLDVTHTIILLNDILELKEKGRQAKTKEDFENKVKKWNTKNNLIDLLEVTKLSKVGRFGANWIAGVGKVGFASEGVLANWESILNALFNKDTAQKYSLLLDEANSEIYARNHIQDFYNRANQIYKFRSPNAWDKFLDYDYMQPLIKLMQEYNRETRTFRQRVFSINNPNGYAESDIELSRAQAITMYAWGLNEKLEQRLMTQFGLDQIRDIFENWLSEEDRKLAWALIDTCEGMREDINEVFINTTGLSLPKVDNYFPSKAERVQSDIDLYHDFFVKSSNPSFIKDRKVCNRIPMKPMSPLEILIPHINKTAKYVVMSEKVNFLNQVFKDTAIKTKMQEIWGSENGAKIYQVMINKLAACTYTNYSKGSNLIKDWANEIGKNYVVANIGGNTKVMFGQLLSMINYAENMPSGEWAAGFVKAWANPVKTFKYMMDNCPYLQSRLAGNTQNEVMSILTSEKDRFRTLKNFMTANTKWGDIIAIIYGGKPYVDYLIKNGMPEKEAFNKFVEDTLRAQQAGTTSSISEWQSEMARNTWTKLFFAFRNTAIQYERKTVDTAIQLAKGDISKGQAIKKIMIYKVLNPILFTSILGNLSLIAFLRALFDGDDDAILNLIKDFAQAVGLSGNNGYGMAFVIINAVEESLLAHFDSDYKDFDTSTPIVSDVQKEVRKILKGDLTLAEYVESIADISGELVGIPANRIINAAEGAIDIVQGKVGVGLSRLAGWGNYTSTKAWTGEAPEKKSKSKSKRKTVNRRRR